MAKQHGGTGVLERAQPSEAVEETLAGNRPLTIGFSGPLPDDGKAGSVGKWVGRVVHGMLKDQPNVEVEQVVVHVYLKDPEAWED